MKPLAKSAKLANVAYDIRGPVLDKARQMMDEGHKIIQLNIGNVAAFGLEPPDEIVQDMIRNLPHSAGYTDSKGLFACPGSCRPRAGPGFLRRWPRGARFHASPRCAGGVKASGRAKGSAVRKSRIRCTCPPAHARPAAA